MITVLNQHLDRARSQPEHIRRNLAFAAALVLTGLISLLWLGGSVASGAFALKDTSFADAKPAAPAAGAAKTPAGISGLVGAASAALSGGDTASAHLQVVDGGRAGAVEEKKVPQAEPTVIPF